MADQSQREQEKLESVQVYLPPAQARRLRAWAALRGGSLSAELKHCVHLREVVEGLIGTQPADIHYVTVPAPEAA